MTDLAKYLATAIGQKVELRDASERLANKAADYWRSIAPVDPVAPDHQVTDLGMDTAGSYKASIEVVKLPKGAGYRVQSVHALAIPLEYGNKITPKHAFGEQARRYIERRGAQTK